ncbi:MAG: isoleucine--tRNA ligase [Planctomycetes bacterium]|nr:isoleucine--tRNA ligase [Planctomycetota bacterium]
MRSNEKKPYPRVPTQPDLPRIEERILAFWEKERIFQASVDGRPTGEGGSNEYVFYDGPPFANGLPHYGHLLTGFVKDIVPRYQTMRGRRVERRFGWDCHGLPAEMGTEKKLGISGRQKILAYGIERFNGHCREEVFKYAGEWERYVKRQARWVDFENDYKTLDLDYMESVMWAFSELYRKGLVYESYRVMPYSWAAESPVSNFETRMDNSYRERQDPALTVRLKLEPRGGDPGPLEILIWTTTPWTLPSNLAVAVGADIEYAVVEKEGECLVLATGVLAKYEKELEGWTRTGRLKGSELVGRKYEPLFPYFKDQPNAFRILSGDFVDTSEGTGVVHLAPGFGEDDQRVCAENEIEVVCPVDGRGEFTEEVRDWKGLNVLEANKPIIAELKQRGVVLRHETYLHNYPHCWRTGEPLIYKALSSWYIRVSDFRERMVELNRSIRWVPETIRDGQFGKWLEGARDWSISRNRFWGSPIPIWRSDDPKYPRIDVYGSLDELERDFGVRPTDLHRPAIDGLTRPNPDDPTGKSTMRRVEEILDGWFESGSMPYAQVHYPFENREWFENHFPADFITEYVAQTRGWFYTMMVLSTALFDRPPFKNCICHGVVVDVNGTKLSKSLRNYPEPDEVCDKYGADALRWFMCSSPIMRGGDLAIDREGKAVGEVVRLVIHPIWNAYSFFCLYANADELRGNFRTEGYGNVLDRYILAKTRALVVGVGDAMDAYDLVAATSSIRGFLEALNNWYIRRSRPRFWRAEKDGDKQDAYDALYTVLEVLCRTVAPFLPLISEEIYRGLTNAKSVHLFDWPDAESLSSEGNLAQDMDRIRQVCSAALGLREERRLRIRLPLASLIVAGPGADRLAPYFDLIRDEVNVKDVCSAERVEDFATFQLKLNARALGPKVGGRMKDLLASARAGDWSSSGGAVKVGDYELEEGEYEMQLRASADQERFAVAALPSNDAVCALEVGTTPELEREGLARDVVRLIQAARKEAAFHVSDRVELALEGSAEVRRAVDEHKSYIMEQTLAASLEFDAPLDGMHVHRGKAGESEFAVGVRTG